VSETFRLRPSVYHIREGKHDITQQDWQAYMKAADTVFELIKGRADKGPVPLSARSAFPFISA